jgi:hypothetical protein
MSKRPRTRAKRRRKVSSSFPEKPGLSPGIPQRDSDSAANTSPRTIPPPPDRFFRLLATRIGLPGVPHDGRPAWVLEHQLHAFEIAYRDTDNPVWVWRAVLACRGATAPPPAWIMAYLGRVAEAFWTLSAMPPADVPAAIVTALEMAREGAGSVFRRIDDSDDLVLAARMHWHMAGGLNETNAKYVVAQELNVSEATALRAWRKHRALFETTPPAS